MRCSTRIFVTQRYVVGRVITGGVDLDSAFNRLRDVSVGCGPIAIYFVQKLHICIYTYIDTPYVFIYVYKYIYNHIGL